MEKENFCKRVIVWAGKMETITEKNHHWAYSGKVPCTGSIRCIHCGKIKDKQNLYEDN